MSSVKGKSLTLQLVFNKTKSDNLLNIKNLNLWGNQLQDLQLIEKMPNLEVISLSVNKISSLRDFSKCNKLHLYLRKNCISDLREIRYLLELPYLKSLWLYDNPCAQQENYREIVIHHLPNLTKLDNNVVTQEERQAAANPKFELDFGALQDERQYAKDNLAPVQQRKIEGFSQQQSEVKRSRPYSQLREGRGSEYVERENVYRGSSNKEVHSTSQLQGEANMQLLTRNKNVLIAVLSLLKELDAGSLQIVRKQTEKELRSR